MRQSQYRLIAISLCILIAGCGGDASGPTRQMAPLETFRQEGMGETPADEPREAASATAGPAEEADFASDMSGYDDPAAPAHEKRMDDRPRRRESEQGQYRRSGQLTAGSIDDVERAEEYCQFLDQTLQSGMFASAVKDVRPHVMLQLMTDDGLPVGGAVLDIDQSGHNGQSLRVTTGSDGRAMLTLSDVDIQTRRCEAMIRLPDGGRPYRETISLDEEVCRIVVPGTETERPRQLDLALIIDTTGSMGDELEYLKREIDDIVARLHETFPKVDSRFALIVYRDQGDQYVSRRFDFTDSLDDLRSKLAQQHASGGGDYPEAVHIALQQAAGLEWRPGNVARVAFLVGDAPPHDHDMLAAFEGASGLRANGVRLYPVASSGVAVKAEFVMRSVAFLTMGQYLFLTDHSGIGNPHAKPHASQYLVEYLDQLMVRMITSELCGRRLQPDEVLAIERGDMELPYGPGPILPEQRQQWQDQSHSSQAASFALPEGVGMWLTLGVVLIGVCVYDSIRSQESN